MSKTCAWYKKGKLKQIFDLDDLQAAGADENVVIERVRYVLLSTYLAPLN